MQGGSLALSVNFAVSHIKGARVLSGIAKCNRNITSPGAFLAGISSKHFTGRAVYSCLLTEWLASILSFLLSLWAVCSNKNKRGVEQSSWISFINGNLKWPSVALHHIGREETWQYRWDTAPAQHPTTKLKLHLYYIPCALHTPQILRRQIWGTKQAMQNTDL